MSASPLRRRPVSRRTFLKSWTAMGGALALSMGSARNVCARFSIGLAAKPSNVARRASNGVPWASDEVRRRLAHNVKTLRLAQGHTQQELGRLCGVRNGCIRGVEQGTVNITLANLEKIARGLGCLETRLLRRIAPGASTATGIITTLSDNETRRLTRWLSMQAPTRNR